MSKRKFYIGDILNLLFYDVNEEHELFLDDDKSEGIDDLIAFMIGITDEGEADEYFEDDFRYSNAMQMCIDSLLCQFEDFTKPKFRNELKSLKKRANKSLLGEEMESNWLSDQARMYVADRVNSNPWYRAMKKKGKSCPELDDGQDDATMLTVESIGYLHIPEGQERFERVHSFELFNDRPMNMN